MSFHYQPGRGLFDSYKAPTVAQSKWGWQTWDIICTYVYLLALAIFLQLHTPPLSFTHSQIVLTVLLHSSNCTVLPHTVFGAWFVAHDKSHSFVNISTRIALVCLQYSQVHSHAGTLAGTGWLLCLPLNLPRPSFTTCSLKACKFFWVIAVTIQGHTVCSLRLTVGDFSVLIFCGTSFLTHLQVFFVNV